MFIDKGWGIICFSRQIGDLGLVRAASEKRLQVGIGVVLEIVA